MDSVVYLQRGAGQCAYILEVNVLNLKSMNIDDHQLKVVYEAAHSRGGPNPTTLRESIVVTQCRHSGKANAGLTFTDCDAPSVDGALDRLADWCERIAKAIRGRGEASVAVVEFSQPVRQDDVEAERIEKVIFSVHMAGALTLDMVRAACPPKSRVNFWDRSHSVKAADGKDMADILIALARPNAAMAIQALSVDSEDDAYDLKRETFFEVARDVFDWL